MLDTSVFHDEAVSFIDVEVPGNALEEDQVFLQQLTELQDSGSCITTTTTRATKKLYERCQVERIPDAGVVLQCVEDGAVVSCLAPPRCGGRRGLPCGAVQRNAHQCDAFCQVPKFCQTKPCPATTTSRSGHRTAFGEGEETRPNSTVAATQGIDHARNPVFAARLTPPPVVRPPRRSFLHFFIWAGAVECVAACLRTSRAIDWTRVDDWGWTPLQCVCVCDASSPNRTSSYEVEAAERRRAEVLRLVLQRIAARTPPVAASYDDSDAVVVVEEAEDRLVEGPGAVGGWDTVDWRCQRPVPAARCGPEPLLERHTGVHHSEAVSPPALTKWNCVAEHRPHPKRDFLFFVCRCGFLHLFWPQLQSVPYFASLSRPITLLDGVYEYDWNRLSERDQRDFTPRHILECQS